MRIWMILFFLALGITANAQTVVKDGKAYEVKGKAIFHEGVDVTADLLSDEKNYIFKTHKDFVKEAKKVEKEKKNLEKDAKKAEKEKKKAEKELKRKKKAVDNLNKKTRKLDQNQDKYNKLKARGDLSPNDDAKWIKKLNGLKNDVEKARRKV